MEIEVLLELIELILTQKDGVEAFMSTIFRGKFCLPYFDYLVKEGFLPDKEVLFSATKMRQIELVRFILEKGVKPTLESFQYAAEHEFFELCSLFVEFGSREILSTPNLENQVIIVCRYNRLEGAKYLINLGVDPTTEDNYAIRWASQKGYLEIVRLLLKHGADPTDNKNEAIRMASREGHLEVVRLLIDKGADPAADNNNAVRWASKRGYLEIVRLLLQKGAKPTDYAIKHASGHDRLKIIDLLNKYKAKF
jgi:ankyrin repeat protein